MELIQILGSNAVVAGLLGVVVGLITQVFKNFKRKSCEGLSFTWIMLAGYSYFSWLIYGVAKQDIFLTIPQSLGTLCMVIILIQFWVYRKKKF